VGLILSNLIQCAYHVSPLPYHHIVLILIIHRADSKAGKESTVDAKAEKVGSSKYL